METNKMPGVYCGRGDAYYTACEYDKAIEKYSKALIGLLNLNEVKSDRLRCQERQLCFQF